MEDMREIPGSIARRGFAAALEIILVYFVSSDIQTVEIEEQCRCSRLHIAMN
jgi:hypothetical protein